MLLFLDSRLATVGGQAGRQAGRQAVRLKFEFLQILYPAAYRLSYSTIVLYSRGW